LPFFEGYKINSTFINTGKLKGCYNSLISVFGKATINRMCWSFKKTVRILQQLLQDWRK